MDKDVFFGNFSGISRFFTVKKRKCDVFFWNEIQYDIAHKVHRDRNRQSRRSPGGGENGGFSFYPGIPGTGTCGRKNLMCRKDARSMRKRKWFHRLAALGMAGVLAASLAG